MRIDHFAYQRATRVAGFGFFLQLVIGIVMLIFSLNTGEKGDTPAMFASAYVLCGVAVWLSLIVVFHQHKLERLEVLEEDELAAGRSGTTSMFDEDDEVRVAARRLRLMHKWLMPATSLGLATVLGLLAWWMWRFLAAQDATGGVPEDAPEFVLSPSKGWAVSICLSLSAACFIFSRFVAGMSNQPAWQNLRGGAGYMVGNALVLFAVAAGVIFRFFDNEAVIEGVAYALPIYMTFIAAETVLNFIMNLYRPRIPGEVPRPAFDSRVLSILAAPDSLVRSINEAVNYQFGFDVTSTWGYQLLMRSVVKLLLIGLVVGVGLSSLVVVEPHQRAVLLSRGSIVDDQIHGAGLLMKLPWPLQSAEVRDVTRVRTLPLTAVRNRNRPLHVWRADREGETDREIEPFIVRPSRFGSASEVRRADEIRGADAARSGGPGLDVALLDAEITLRYRIRDGERGLLEYLRFAPETRGRRDRLNMRDKALRAIALREVSDRFARMRLDEIIARQRAGLASELAAGIQQGFDRHGTGVEVVGVNLPVLQPAGTAAQQFEDLAIASQNSFQYEAAAEQEAARSLAYLIGDTDNAPAIVELIEQYNALRADAQRDERLVVELRAEIERRLVTSGGIAARMIDGAYRERWGSMLEDKADAARVRGQLPSYLAAPALFRERETMAVMRQQLSGQSKIVIGTEATGLDLDISLTNPTPLIDTELATSGDEGAN